MNHDWLIRMLKQRIDDKALLSLIKQWLKARVKTADEKWTDQTQVHRKVES